MMQASYHYLHTHPPPSSIPFLGEEGWPRPMLCYHFSLPPSLDDLTSEEPPLAGDLLGSRSLVLVSHEPWEAQVEEGE